MASVKITLFIPNGDPQGLRIAEIANWTGKAIAAPRVELETLFARDEMNQAGVDFLIGIDPKDGKPTAYIGEGEDIGKRLRQQRDKDFWVSVIVFVSKDENLTKAHIWYLEGRLIEIASGTYQCALVNDQTSGAKLPEADRGDMEVFLERIRQLLPILGCEILAPRFHLPATKDEQSLICTIKDLTAYGKRTAKGFIVFKKSEATAVMRQSAQETAPWLVQLRDELLQEKTLAPDGSRHVFAEDYEFPSPSAAAAVIRGGNSTGLTSWHTRDGKTLQELEATV